MGKKKFKVILNFVLAEDIEQIFTTILMQA